MRPFRHAVHGPARPVVPARETAGRGLAAALLAAWFLLPLVPLVLWAAADRWSSPSPVPTALGSLGVRRALADGAVPALLQSSLLGLAVAAVATPVGALAARALVRHRVPGRRVVLVLLLAPVALPAFAVVVGLTVLLLRLRIAGPPGVVLLLAAFALPYTIVVMRAAYAAADPGHEEQARLLGATPVQVLVRVQLPLVAPALARAAFLAFLVGWSDYLITLLVAGGRLTTVPLLVAATATGVGDTSETAVLSLAAVLPPLVLLVVVERALRRGRAAGG